MKKTINSALIISLLLTLAGASCALAQPTIIVLYDGGGYPIQPTLGPDDQSQTNVPSSHQNPPGLNYYENQPNAPGQTFTTGNNPNGYVLNTLALYDTDDTGGGFGNQTFTLNVYTLSGDTATIYASYTSQSVSLYDFYWFQWSGLNNLALLPNTKYAFALQGNGDGWMSVGNVSGDKYADPAGQAASIPFGGGAMIYSSSTGYDASFDVGLTVATNVQIGTLTASPGLAVTSGTPVTLSAPIVVGAVPLYYQWQTDGGSGTLTNIPGASSAALPVDTTGFAIGGYKYALIVSNGTSAATNSLFLGIYQANTAMLSDVGSSVIPGTYDLSQLTGGGTGDGLNYYDDNNPPPGQTFTTGANSQGYYLTSLTVGTGDQSSGTSGHTSSLKPYTLQVYEVSGNSAALIATYTNSSFSFTFGDWLAWSGFSPLFLKPNTTYAYSFRLWPTSEGGWAAMSVSDNDPYAGGQNCVVPVTGGTITFGSSGLSDAAFDVGLSPVGITPTSPSASAIVVTPSRSVAVGTLLTLAETATGAEPLNYQWRTDGGSGGALTNIPSASATNLVEDTTGWIPGIKHQFDVTVANIYGSATSAVSSVATFYPAATATLTDIGADVPIPAPIDVSQTSPAGGVNKPDGLNYYYNNDAPPGQTFTTGNNPGGYMLNTLAIDFAGDANLQSQMYVLRIYAVSGSTATLYATYNSQNNFLINADTDCIKWSGLNLPMAASTTYAYTLFGGQGWDNLANVGGNPYPDGEVCLIPPGGGAISYGSSRSYDGVFVLGFTLPGYPVVSQPAYLPSSTVYAGTPVTASASVTGTGPFTSYQWQTDGGSGVYTNIPGATSAMLSVDTTGLDGMMVGYNLVVGNGSGMTTGQVSELTIMPAQAPVFAADITNSLYQPSSQITSFVGGSVILSDTNVQGTLPMAYQWQADGGTFAFTNIPGATNNALTLLNLKVSDSGHFQLVATNSQGPAQTSYAALTVLPQPTNPFMANFQFHTMVNADVGNYNALGVIGTGTFWNQVIGPSIFPSPGGIFTCASGYSDDGITNCGISWTVFSENSWGWTATPAIALLDSAANAYSPGPSTFMFTLPSGLYNLVMYSCNGTEAGSPNHIEAATFTINGVSKTILPTTDQQFLLNTNYVFFNSVVVSNAVLVGQWSSTNDFAAMNGVQLQYVGVYKPLSFQATNGQLKLDWSPGTLMEAPSLTGPWTTNSTLSPVTVNPTAAQMFYRVKTQ